MEKAIVWYKLWLKLYIKRPSTWIFAVAVGLLLWVISSISLPDSSNLLVGVCYPGGTYGEELEKVLKEGNSIFTFVAYGDEQKLYEDVLGGRLECGFLFDEDFQEKMEKGRIRGSITCLSTPLGFKSEVAKETLYAHLLMVSSRDILIDGELKVFGEEEETRTEQLLKREQEYRLSQEVFQLKTIMLSPKEGQEQEKEVSCYPMQAAGGLLIFLFLFLSQGGKFRQGEKGVQKAMQPKDHFLFGVMRGLAAGTLPAAALLLMLQILGSSRGWIRESGMLLLFLCAGSLWSQLAGYFMKKETTFVAVAFALALIHIFICPILVDWSSFIPAMKYVSLLFPLGIYLL
ncbi:MAG: hypothetical protein PUI46_00100 [Lachnospiraceae bacterium]|nr:hypothetical protein [Lachnospiraceae bacterium]